jgi:hypothetical protein
MAMRLKMTVIWCIVHCDLVELNRGVREADWPDDGGREQL